MNQPWYVEQKKLGEAEKKREQQLENISKQIKKNYLYPKRY